MKKFDSNQLNQFTGTDKYYRISRRHLLTDLSDIGTANWFVLVSTLVAQGSDDL